jgi:hypothetical protein
MSPPDSKARVPKEEFPLLGWQNCKDVSFWSKLGLIPKDSDQPMRYAVGAAIIYNELGWWLLMGPGFPS